ncbi:MAG TPA: hypothetical protein PKY29_04340 [Ferruginibacter sp.]|nr:hypothetical protein [Ferruginibacter sp.]HRQ20517.1 hypothetical protein [Ferruginibacter sp.]
MEEKIPILNIEKVKSYFLKNYSPGNPSDTGVIFLSLEQIHSSLIKAFPVPEITQTLIYQWLEESGFVCFDVTGTMNIKWVLKTNNVV